MKYSPTDKQTSLQKILSSRLTQALLFLSICLISVPVWHQYQILSDTDQKRLAAEIEYQQLHEQQQRLEVQVAALQDDFQIEHEIRRHFDVAREGEQVVIILDPPPDPTVLRPD